MDAALRAKHEIWRCGESRPAIQSIVTSADFSLRLLVAVTILSSSRMTAAPSDHESRTSSGHQTRLTYVITNPNPSKHEKMDAVWLGHCGRNTKRWMLCGCGDQTAFGRRSRSTISCLPGFRVGRSPLSCPGPRRSTPKGLKQSGRRASSSLVKPR